MSSVMSKKAWEHSSHTYTSGSASAIFAYGQRRKGRRRDSNFPDGGHFRISGRRRSGGTGVRDWDRQRSA